MGRAVVMLACIIGNVYSGLMIMALQSKLKHSEDEYVSGMWINWRKTYHELQYYSKRALTSAGRLVGLHRRLRRRDPQVSMLHPLKVYSKFKKPNMAKLFFPLVKVFNRIALFLNDKEVLTAKEFNKKVKYYLAMRLNLAELKKRLRDKLIEDSQTHVLYNLTYQQALGYNDISVKMHQVFNSSSLKLFVGFERHSRSMRVKAEHALKMSQTLLKTRKQPSIKFSHEFAAIVQNTIKELRRHRGKHIDKKETVSKPRLVSLAAKLKEKKLKTKHKAELMQIEKIKQISQQTHDEHQRLPDPTQEKHSGKNESHSEVSGQRSHLELQSQQLADVAGAKISDSNSNSSQSLKNPFDVLFETHEGNEVKTAKKASAFSDEAHNYGLDILALNTAQRLDFLKQAPLQSGKGSISSLESSTKLPGKFAFTSSLTEQQIQPEPEYMLEFKDDLALDDEELSNLFQLTPLQPLPNFPSSPKQRFAIRRDYDNDRSIDVSEPSKSFKVSNKSFKSQDFTRPFDHKFKRRDNHSATLHPRQL